MSAAMQGGARKRKFAAVGSAAATLENDLRGVTISILRLSAAAIRTWFLHKETPPCVTRPLAYSCYPAEMNSPEKMIEQNAVSSSSKQAGRQATAPRAK